MKEQMQSNPECFIGNELKLEAKHTIPTANEQTSNNQRANSQPPLEKKYKRRINLIKQINKIQLQQVMVTYKPQDSPSVAKRNSKELQSQGEGNNNEKQAQFASIPQKQSTFRRSIPNNRANKAVKDNNNPIATISTLNQSKTTNEMKDQKNISINNKQSESQNNSISRTQKKEQNEQIADSIVQKQFANQENNILVNRQDKGNQNQQESIGGTSSNREINKQNEDYSCNINTEVLMMAHLHIQYKQNEDDGNQKIESLPSSPSILSSASSYSNLCSYSHIEEVDEQEQTINMPFTSTSNINNLTNNHQQNQNNQQVVEQPSSSSSLSQSFQLFEQGNESPLMFIESRQSCSFASYNNISGRKQQSRNQQRSPNKDKTISSTLDVSCNNQIESNQDNNRSPLKLIHHSQDKLNIQQSNQLNNNTSEKSPKILYQFQQIKKEIPLIKLSEQGEPQKNQQIEFDNNEHQLKKLDGQQKPKGNRKNLSQYVKVIRHRKIVCNNISNNNNLVNQSMTVNQENNKDGYHEIGNSISSPQTTTNTSTNRRRVLSQQGPSQQRQIPINFFNIEDYQSLLPQQKSLTPGGNTSRIQDNIAHKRKQLNKLDGINIDKFRDKVEQLLNNDNKTTTASENRSRQNKFKLECNQTLKLSQSPRKNTTIKSTINNNDTKVKEVSKPKKDDRSKIQIQDQLEKEKLKQDESCDEHKITHAVSDSQTQVQSYLARQQEFLEQIDNSYITPSSVKDIMMNIQLRSKALSNHSQNNNSNIKKNFKISSNPIKAVQQPTTTQQSKSRKEESKENRENTIPSRQTLSDKPNKKIRSKTLLTNSSLNRQQNLNFDEDSNKNIQKQPNHLNPSSNKKADSDMINVKKRPPLVIRSNNVTPKASQNIFSAKQNADFNERFSKLIQQLNLDSKIKDIKNLIETCNKPKRRSSLMKPQKKSKQVRFLEDEEIGLDLPQYSKEI